MVKLPAYGAIVLQAGLRLMDVHTREVVTLEKSTHARLGVHPDIDETTYNINGKLYYNETYTQNQEKTDHE